MNIFFTTTFNSRLFEEYAHNFIETYLKTKQEIPLRCYVDDDYSYPRNPNISYIKLHEAMPQILQFKERHKDIILDLEYEAFTEDKIFDSKFKTDSQALDGTRKEMKKVNGYKEIDKGDGMDGHVILRDEYMFNFLDHRKGKRKYQKVENKNASDLKQKKVTNFQKFQVQLKNFLFKLMNR